MMIIASTHDPSWPHHIINIDLQCQQTTQFVSICHHATIVDLLNISDPSSQTKLWYGIVARKSQLTTKYHSNPLVSDHPYPVREHSSLVRDHSYLFRHFLPFHRFFPHNLFINISCLLTDMSCDLSFRFVERNSRLPGKRSEWRSPDRRTFPSRCCRSASAACVPWSPVALPFPASCPAETPACRPPDDAAPKLPCPLTLWHTSRDGRCTRLNRTRSCVIRHRSRRGESCCFSRSCHRGPSRRLAVAPSMTTRRQSAPPGGSLSNFSPWQHYTAINTDNICNEKSVFNKCISASR